MIWTNGNKGAECIWLKRIRYGRLLKVDYLFNAQKSEMLSDVALANVEALAMGEDVDMRRGYILSVKSTTCTVCEWTGGDNDYCDVYTQLPDCY